ncbi:hypothetical protein [Salinicola salarius]|uniref:hypothetical protein n=1 Tax=Salinicola salarius TaxID=430457 RepID=UPI0013006D07|nr:hypothetical protein [Salinicola salarius]
MTQEHQLDLFNPSALPFSSIAEEPHSVKPEEWAQADSQVIEIKNFLSKRNYVQDSHERTLLDLIANRAKLF